MNKLYALFTLMAMTTVAALGVNPCWTDFDTCGSSTLCDNISPEAQRAMCTHLFCDQDMACPGQSASKKMMYSTRWKYSWWEGSTLVTCVDSPIYSSGGFCCNCNEPGVKYPLE